MALPRTDLMVALYRLNQALRRDSLDALDRETIEGLAETALNVIYGTLPSDERQLRALRRHKKDLIELTQRETSLEDRRRLLQKGGLFKSVFDIAIPTLRRKEKYDFETTV